MAVVMIKVRGGERGGEGREEERREGKGGEGRLNSGSVIRWRLPLFIFWTQVAHVSCSGNYW